MFLFINALLYFNVGALVADHNYADRAKVWRQFLDTSHADYSWIYEGYSHVVPEGLVDSYLDGYDLLNRKK